MKTINLPPRAASLTESMRDIGYSLGTALADIIDNSIAASASKVGIWFEYRPKDITLAVVDNGAGMSREKLIEAMRLGSTNPRAERAAGDLGRFGLGLKTASFSQCRKLTVVSRKKDSLSGAEWDLDRVSQQDDWMLALLDKEEISTLPYLDKLEEQGTLVLWRGLDRLQSLDKNAFRKEVAVAEKHLEIVFHRYVAPELAKPKLDILINGHAIEAFDPFLLQNKATEHLPSEAIEVNGHQIVIQPYILPHHSKLSPESQRMYEDRSNYMANQGFYVYRNRRLMAWGDWFKLAQKNEVTKLARVRIDFPNALDELWTIDIKKSSATPPQLVKRKLKQILGKISQQGAKVYMQRGKQQIDKQSPIWIRYENEGVHYLLNRKHPIITSIANNIEYDKKKLLMVALDIIEKSVPVEAIYADYSISPQSVDRIPSLSKGEIREMILVLRNQLDEIDDEQLRGIICGLKPFCDNLAIVHRIIEEEFHVSK